MGQRAYDAEGINRILPLDFIICCDYGNDVPYFFTEEDVFSVEKRTGVRKDWSNEDLTDSLRGALGREIFKRWDSYGEDINLLCYRSVAALEKRASRLKMPLRIYAVPEKIKKHFDNKILLDKNLDKLSLPRIPGKVDVLGKRTFSDVRKELSLPFVIQFPYGSSGNFTFIIKEEKEYNRLRVKWPDQPVVMRKYINGFSLNVNAVNITGENGHETICSFPSVQITGLRECSNFQSAFCGNDYTAAQDIDPAMIRQVKSHVQAIGAWMASSGFRGVFGMDFVTKNGTVYPVEINPRFQNSTSLLTSLNARDYSAERTSLFLLHIAEFLQDKDKVLKKYLKDINKEELMDPVEGCQVILHNKMHKSVIAGDLSPGVYRMENGSLEPVKKGASFDLLQGKDEVLVTCGIPKQYSEIIPNAPVCKIQSKKSLLNISSKKNLSQEAKKIVKSVYKELALKAASRSELVGAKG